jgi:catechol 2,3-dioxygenase-like lactoylglutathione lyase family enzyme
MRRVGHVGIRVTDMDRSLAWYTNTLGLTFTGRWPQGEVREVCFLRFDEDHHDIVLFTHTAEVDPEATGYVDLEHIALEVEGRDEWLKALAELQRKGVEIVEGPLVHGPEGDPRNIGGSGTRSFYFLDPDGNKIEIYCDMMKVPNGEQFPRQEYKDVFRRP